MNGVEIKNATQNNLKNVNCFIPKKKFTCVSGVSGSGKSSLILSTLAKEAQRQLYSTFSTFARSRMPKISKPKFSSINGISPVIVIDQTPIKGNSRSTFGTITEVYTMIRLLFARCGSPQIGGSELFSFNSPQGMCEECHGIGETFKVDVDALLDKSKTLEEGAILHPDFKTSGWFFDNIRNSNFFDMDKKLSKFKPKDLNKLLYSKKIKIKNEEKGKKKVINRTFEGVITNIERRMLSNTDGSSNGPLKRNPEFFKNEKCEVCGGIRVNEEARAVEYRGKHLSFFIQEEVSVVLKFLKSIAATIEEKEEEEEEELSVQEEVEMKIIEPLIERLQNIVDLGIGYLSLDRKTSTLSGGESQRTKISKQLGSDLVDMTYIFDEPTTGLHPSQVHLIIKILKKLRDKGNTVIVIEHDLSFLKEADYIIEMGVGAGTNGGTLVFQGDLNAYRNAQTVTTKYLFQNGFEQQQQGFFDDEELLSPATTSDDDDDEEEEEEEEEEEKFFQIRNANVHNLKNINVDIPKRQFVAITGLAGSGKSSLIMDVFLKKYPSSVAVSQNRITKNSRSCPATYTGIFTPIRKLFAKNSGKSISYFSFNSKGCCTNCKGSGMIKINMHFLEDVKTICPECKGKRFKSSVLKYLYKKKSIADVLEMTIAEAKKFFEDVDEEIEEKLRNLEDVGVGYLTLGQSLSTLSMGEANRVVLSSYLNKSHNVMIYDEPSMGLSCDDTMRLIRIFKRLVKAGNSVIVIEHNMSIVRYADYVIDLGPGGGQLGGRIIGQGTVSDFIKLETKTAQYLKEEVNGSDAMSKKRKRPQDLQKNEHEPVNKKRKLN